MSIEAMKMAQEIMRNNGDVSVDEYIAADKALSQAIEQAEKQAPVARPFVHIFNVTKNGALIEWEPTSMAFALPDGIHAIYTSPQPRQPKQAQK